MSIFDTLFKSAEKQKREAEVEKLAKEYQKQYPQSLPGITSTSNSITIKANASTSTATTLNMYSYWNSISNKYKFHNWMKKKPSTVEGFPEIIACHPYGSRYTCDPAPTDTDDDTLVLVKEFPNPEKMKELGWDFDGDEKYPSSMFQSYRRDFKNLIMVENRHVYIRGVAAALVCKQMNLMDKNERIAIHTVIMGSMGVNFSVGPADAPLPNRGLL